jgi:hypothetical protein
MNIGDFKKIILSFADKPNDLVLNKGTLLTEIRGELIEAELSEENGNLFVKEDDVKNNAKNWIKNRIANLPQLAERIVDFLPVDRSYIDPCSSLLDDLEYDPSESEEDVETTSNKIVEKLNRNIPGTSKIIYLTSDAGEGKTTIINYLANKQAIDFKNNKTDWLLVPIPLGGRPFLRFDDVVIASIVNNLRFRYFYYESFIELVKLGLIVPAFDGFEEMFMQHSTGEALSATGNLINKLDSSGSMLIAARKAYFDYKSFNSQAKLLDNISSSVTFSRISIRRWNKNQFVDYVGKRGLSNASELYEIAFRKLRNPNHPILTRPVLVKQLVDVFNDIKDIDNFVNDLENVSNYFPAFVNAIITREANYKWIDTTGEPYRPILSAEQHYQLLSSIAEEMWINSSDRLNESILDLIAEIFSEKHNFGINTSRQVIERIKQHALLIKVDSNISLYKFDHEEFYEFFLGVAIANIILEKNIPDIKTILSKSQLPSQTSEAIISQLKKNSIDIFEVKSVLDDAIIGENQLSFVKENIGYLVILLFNNESHQTIKIERFEFPINSLTTVNLRNIAFDNCHFQNTSLDASNFQDCTFSDCTFDRIEYTDSTSFSNIKLVDCEIITVYNANIEKGYYDKYSITQQLNKFDIQITSNELESNLVDQMNTEEDEKLELTEKALRRFIRQNTPINENIFRVRLGRHADIFFRQILPDLIKCNILIEVNYQGQGRQKRFKMGVKFKQIDEALNKCNGSYEKFISLFK